MVSDQDSKIHYTKIRVRFQCKREPFYFIGSQIRGALGYALKETVCINPTTRCAGCFVAEQCLYYDFYESKTGYVPYRLDFLLGQGYYDFTLYLFGEALEKVPVVTRALHRMLTLTDLGKAHLIPSAYEILATGEKEQYIPPKTTVPNLTLRFVTPLRIKYRNRFVRSGNELTLHTLITSLYRRRQMLTDRIAAGEISPRLPFEPQGRLVRPFVRFKDLSRYSGRQKGYLKIGGLLGEVEIEGIDPQSYRLLKTGEVIGMGKQTSFGLGKIEVVDRK